MKSIRTQTDDLQDKMSAESAITFDPRDDRTRQEFKEDADINVILKRFGADSFNARPAQYGIIDFDLDLQQAKHAINDTRLAWNRLPKHLKDRFPNWESLLEAVDAGAITSKDLEPPKPDDKIPTPEAQPNPNT